MRNEHDACEMVLSLRGGRIYQLRMKRQTWLVTGATGLIGSALSSALIAEGHKVRALGRTNKCPKGTQPFVWNPETGMFPSEALQGVDVVVHLDAASVGKRWTTNHKKAIFNSLVSSTSLLRSELLKANFCGHGIQASAIGIYGHHPAPCDEQTESGSGFLAEVAHAWERAAIHGETLGCRLVQMRLGLVLAPNGGTLKKLLPIYKLGLGAPLGVGKQPMGWIHIDDVVRFIVWAAANDSAQGPFNVVAPEHASNALFSTCLAGVLNRPHWAPAVPRFALHLAMGSMSSLLLEGQRAVPSKLQQAGFVWKHPELADALANCVHV